ncbi:MAG TPA: B12-binding domain-containing radical SAM protein [Lachnoclostridium phytofermentans]|uniref:B12-binding domain-containing radical SAM protein n=1 Tax=Lachnoclostridium phytofermentans TaxID=66219 RepID=A0A3D2X670_9FIRM|nr:DUF4080 domain-containing protein [Lachnoclostridium sp.]HCL02639.1 B12-binding domain-containing radical SAM protein [Lachnoclostridium phytofermentans]
MKILLTAINAKYIHSNPAIYYLKSYAKEYRDYIELAEYTINQYTDDILQSIYRKRPTMLAFSCYIWNISMVEEIIREYRKLDDSVKIWLGGPEVSYDPEECLKRLPEIDGIMIGEGEATFEELASYYLKQEDWNADCKTGDVSKTLADIEGIAYRRENGEINKSSARKPMDFSRLPFLYKEAMELSEFSNRIIYYETSRGCPFSCSYCLSSIDKRVRFRDLDLVYQELGLFLDKKVAQVKFIDRTFNCKKSHAMGIWQFIKEHDNGITNFHFEIAADILDEEQLSLLETLRPGLIQLEIGVQSTNDRTIGAINRRMDLFKVSENVDRIKKADNIHQHLDLIAGLPFEDYTSFGTSFNEVYAMRPDQLQLGFLKVLKGSYMEEVSKEYGIVYKAKPPYEVLYTKWLSYDDVIRLKGVEEMTEVYYNSGQFKETLAFIEHFIKSPFHFYEDLAKFYETSGLFGLNHNRIRRYEILLEYLIERFDSKVVSVAKQMMIFDLYKRERLKTRPSFAPYPEEYKKVFKAYLTSQGTNKKGEQLHLEHFDYDIIEAASTGNIVEKDLIIKFDYQKKTILHGEAEFTILTQKEIETMKCEENI